MNKQRLGRIGEEIKKVISTMLLLELKDPGIAPMSSISRVEVTRDLSFAEVYVSVLGDDDAKRSTMEALERAKGHIRSAVGKSVSMRVTPELIFHLDESIEKSMELNRLIDEVIRTDEQSHGS